MLKAANRPFLPPKPSGKATNMAKDRPKCAAATPSRPLQSPIRAFSRGLIGPLGLPMAFKWPLYGCDKMKTSKAQ